MYDEGLGKILGWASIATLLLGIVSYVASFEYSSLGKVSAIIFGIFFLLLIGYLVLKGIFGIIEKRMSTKHGNIIEGNDAQIAGVLTIIIVLAFAYYYFSKMWAALAKLYGP
ncbi:MAG TPA: hypothetical protein VJI13_06045 [Candidatus Norongarragalinales archaeon]|nr:hypothetical protein [Candidatus Norongarragalinales archaeon]